MSSRRLLFVSPEAFLADTAWQALREGHEVKLFTGFPPSELGDGFVPKVSSWEAHVDWAEAIIFEDSMGQGHLAERLRAEKYPVIGGSQYTDKLEDDRAFGQLELEKAGIPILPQASFDSFDEACSFVREQPARYVFKPCGLAQNNKRFVYVGMREDGADVADVLTAYQRVWGSRIDRFQLQRFVEGVEIGVGGFFNGDRFLRPWNINFEHKRLCAGDMGPLTGEMGTSMFWSETSNLADATLMRLEPVLRREGFVGYFDLNCIVNAAGIHPLEVTPRFGYPTINIQQEGIVTPIGDFLFGLANGKDEDFQARSGFQVGVSIRVPPFPYDEEQSLQVFGRGMPIRLSGSEEGIHIQDTKRVNGDWYVCGRDSCPLVVSGHGETMAGAIEAAYARVKGVMIPNMFFRTDIGQRWFNEESSLREWGYL